MVFSRKKSLKKNLAKSSRKHQIESSSHKPTRPKILQCLQNKCKVEVENIDYLMNGKNSINLSGLPEWYYSDDCFGFDQTSNSHVDDFKQSETNMPEADVFDSIQIMDTFSLASSANTDIKLEKNELKIFHDTFTNDFSTSYFSNAEHLSNSLCKSEMSENISRFSPEQNLKCNNQINFSSEDMTSVFHSPALDNLLASETKKLDPSLCFNSAAINLSPTKITFNTPSCQSSYVKTLQTALLEREKLVSNEKEFHSSSHISFDVESPSKSSIHSHFSVDNSSGLLQPSLRKKKSKSNLRKAPMLKHINKQIIKFALTALQTADLLSPGNNDLSIDSTANAIKKRLSKTVDLESLSKPLISQNILKNIANKSLKKSNESSIPSIKFSKPGTKLSRVSKSKNKFLQKISMYLASKAASALQIGFVGNFVKAKKAKRNFKALLRKVTCLKPISLNQAIAQYILYQAKKWRVEKICKEYQNFCFDKLPIVVRKVKAKPKHLQIEISRHKLRWKEFVCDKGVMIFPDSYSVPDNTIKRYEESGCNTFSSLSCARTRTISDFYIIRRERRKKNRKKEIPSSQSTKTNLLDDEKDNLENVQGGVMVIHFSHSKNHLCNMIIKIMSFCIWHEKAEEIMTIIIDNHFELQSMQRGRYIRTVTDGFLVEVLRDSSCQVTSKNMPLDVQSQFAGSTLPDVSLVKISAKQDSNKTEFDNLIDFSKAIESMLKLDKKLAKPKVNKALKLKKINAMDVDETSLPSDKTSKTKKNTDFEISVSDSKAPSSFGTKFNLNRILKDIVKKRSASLEKDKNESNLKYDLGTIGCLQKGAKKNNDVSKSDNSHPSVSVASDINSSLLPSRTTLKTDFCTSKKPSNFFDNDNEVLISFSNSNTLNSSSNKHLNDSDSNLSPHQNFLRRILKKHSLDDAEPAQTNKKIKFVNSSMRAIEPSTSNLSIDPSISQSEPSASTPALRNTLVKSLGANIQLSCGSGSRLQTYLAIPVKVIPMAKDKNGVSASQNKCVAVQKDKSVLSKFLSPKIPIQTFNTFQSQETNQLHRSTTNISSAESKTSPMILQTNKISFTSSSSSVSSESQPSLSKSKVTTISKILSSAPTSSCKLVPCTNAGKTVTTKIVAFPKAVKKEKEISPLAVSSSITISVPSSQIAPGLNGIEKHPPTLTQDAALGEKIQDEIKPGKLLKITKPGENEFLLFLCADNEVLKLCNKLSLSADQVYLKLKAVYDKEPLENLARFDKRHQLLHLKDIFVHSLHADLLENEKKVIENGEKLVEGKGSGSNSLTVQNEVVLTQNIELNNKGLSSPHRKSTPRLRVVNPAELNANHSLSNSLKLYEFNSFGNHVLNKNEFKSESDDDAASPLIDEYKSNKKCKSQDDKSTSENSFSDASARNTPTLLSELSESSTPSLDLIEDPEITSLKEELEKLKALEELIGPETPGPGTSKRKIIAEKKRRLQLTSGTRRLRAVLTFRDHFSTSQYTIIVQAAAEIKFRKMEKNNLAAIRRLLMEINYKLQFQLQILQNKGDLTVDKLSDLKNLHSQIRKDKQSIADIQNRHQTDTMCLFQLKEVEVDKLTLLNGKYLKPSFQSNLFSDV